MPARLQTLVPLLCLAALPAVGNDDTVVESSFEIAQRRLARTAATLPDPTYFPRSSLPDGTWRTVRNDNKLEWTQGFFPGCLWLLYRATQEPYWKARAEAWTGTLEIQKTNKETHDLGFKLMPSYGLELRKTSDQAASAVLLTAADSLASRYNPLIGVIDTASWNPAWDVPTVVDTMMNLELLLWASEEGNRPELKAMALSHALKTYRDMVRPDGGTYHFVDYDHVTGAVRSRGTYQGYSDSSTWSRGQAWAIYGFTVVYRYTRNATALEAAKQTANYYLDHLPVDFVPNWDFQAPTQKKDSSAAAATASALLELSKFVGDAGDRALGERYRNAAISTLSSLAAPPYINVDSTDPAILLHGVGHLPANQEVDVGLIYGDYYLLEALSRLKPDFEPPWYSRMDALTGLRTVTAPHNDAKRWQGSFELTPLGGAGGELGYADDRASIASIGDTGLRMRLSDSGGFEVWNGDHYDSLTQYAYAPNVTYRVRLRVDLDEHRYSLWVSPPVGDEVQLADSFAFATNAPAPSGLDRMLLKAGQADGDFKVANHRLTSSTEESEDEPLQDWINSEGSGTSGSGRGCSASGSSMPAAWAALGVALVLIRRKKGASRAARH